MSVGERKVYDCERPKSLTSTPAELGRLFAAPISIALLMGDSVSVAMRLACAFGMRMFSIQASGAVRSSSSFQLRDLVFQLQSVTPSEIKLCNQGPQRAAGVANCGASS